jgi:hypothetical protein
LRLKETLQNNKPTKKRMDLINKTRAFINMVRNGKETKQRAKKSKYIHGEQMNNWSRDW